MALGVDDIPPFALALVTALSSDDVDTAIGMIRDELGAERDTDASLVLLAVSSLAAQAVERAATAEMRTGPEILSEWGARLAAAR